MRAFARTAALLVATCALAACATTDSGPDPFESVNRASYEFTAVVDKATLKPIAKGYRKFVPGLVRSGVSNFYENAVTPRSSLNNFLQGKPGSGFSELARFLVNTTVGVGGLIDVASATEIPKSPEDFEQTFAVWGLDAGPYVYVPFLGPHTTLGLIARPFDFFTDPLNYIDDTGTEDRLRVMRIIDIRQSLLPAEDIILDSEDPYIALRSAFLQNREFRIYDGDPPTSEEDDALFEEFFDDDTD